MSRLCCSAIFVPQVSRHTSGLGNLMAYLRLITVCFLLVYFKAVFAASMPPEQLGVFVLGKPVTKSFTGKVNSLGNYEIPITTTYEMWDGFVGKIGGDLISDFALLQMHQKRIANIVFYFRDPTFQATKRTLSKTFGIGMDSRIRGNESCSDIEITTWSGKNSTLVLAVVGGSPGSTRVNSVLELRSNLSYPKLKNKLEKSAVDVEDGECNWQAAWYRSPLTLRSSGTQLKRGAP